MTTWVFERAMMQTQDRRRADNAELRLQMRQVQAASQRLKDMTDRLEQQTLEMLRSGEIVALPDQHLATKAQGQLLRQQQQVLNDMRQKLMGASQVGPVPGRQALLSQEELAALLAPSPSP